MDCSEYRQELIQSAKAFIDAYLEQAILSGKINPPCGIFLAKNWLGLKDTISLEESVPDMDYKKSVSADDIRRMLKRSDTENK